MVRVVARLALATSQPGCAGLPCVNAQPTHDAHRCGRSGDHGSAVSTRALIIAALLCGVLILVAFAVQVMTLTN